MTSLGKGLLPDIEAKCGCHKWTLQHDGAPAHTARNTMEYLEKENIDFIEPDIMAPKQLGSRRLRCLGCPSAASLSRTKIQDCGRTEANTEWKNLSQRFIDSCINE